MTIVPVEDELTRPYWEGLRRGELRLQRCLECDHVWHPPLPLCPRCRQDRIVWTASSGIGTIHSYSQVERAAHPATADWVPYTVLLVQLPEGPIVVSQLRGPVDGRPLIGAQVRVAFEPVDQGVVLAYFQLIAEVGTQ